jgi:hypothetical protein
MTDPTTTPTPPEGLTDEELFELAAAAFDGCAVDGCNRFRYCDEIYASELLAYARAAIAAHEAARAQLPPNYIDDGHTGEDRKLLEAFYVASRAEGGTADEIVLRGIRAAIAADRAARPAPTPEEIESTFGAWWAESYPSAPVGNHSVRSHVAFALHLLRGVQ